MAESERLSKLLSMLAKTPADPFVLYGAAMEFKKVHQYDRAIEYFDRTIQADAGYCYAYFQKGQTLEAAGDLAAARATYDAGIVAATKKGDDHARQEIAGALEMVQG
jgi:tetratricopeptide (TPR) repeat protein